MTPSVITRITSPEDHRAAWQAAADAAGVSLSEWVGDAANAKLGAQAKKLSKRRPAHRPKKEAQP